MTMQLPGDAVPFFHAPVLDGNARYAFDTAAGRAVLLLFAGSAAIPMVAQAIARVMARRALFDDVSASFFGVSVDREDAATGRIAGALPGVRWFLDHDRAVSRLYGACGPDDDRYRPHWLVLDRALRVAARFELGEDEAALDALARIAAEVPDVPAPVIVVPRVIEPALCRTLIDRFEAAGGTESGFMREENGITVAKLDHAHKRRADWQIDDEALRTAVRARLRRFLLPAIARAFQFEVTRIERWMIACYDGEPRDGGVAGHFRAHRDNTTKGTAHRKFACTINLNAEEFDGGDLSFPEYGPRTYRAPTGGAVIFSCGLLHEARAVTRGRRYAFLPFFYDEAGAALREENMRFVGEELSGYRAAQADVAMAPDASASGTPAHNAAA